MEDITRRMALKYSAATSLLATTAGRADDKDKAKLPTEKERVMAIGMTEAEAECWEAVANAAGKFFDLPKLHVMDDHEVAHAIHIIQNKLLGRPAYRKYLGKDK